MTNRILRIDASARREGSVTRDLVDRIIQRLGPDTTVVRRDLADGIPLIDETWIAAAYTDASDRTSRQAQALAASDALVAELQAADTVVIGLPIYNFGVPASFKAWVDQVARAGVTFRYSPQGPQGLLADKRAILAVASGGTEAGSAMDHATGFARAVLGFIGITDVSVVAADRLMIDAEGTMRKALGQVDALDRAA